MSRPERILVTGAAGFIGSTLVDRLLAEGRRVVGLDNFDPFYPEETKQANIASALGDPAFEFVRGDIRDPAGVDALFARAPGFDAVVHLAALAGVRPSLERPADYVDVNVNGTSVLFDAAVRHGNPNFVFASSSSVYGERSDGPFKETDRVDSPISPYAASKKSGELIAHAFHHARGIPVSCVRFFTAYGPRQRPDLAVRKFAELMRSGAKLPVFGGGTSQRDFTYIDDVVDGIVRAVDYAVPWGIFNFGAGRTVTVNEMIACLSKSLGVEAKLDHQPMQVGDVSKTWADISHARETLGYDPQTTFEDGVDHFVAWLGARE